MNVTFQVLPTPPYAPACVVMGALTLAPVLRLPAGGTAGDLHDQRDRERQRQAAQNPQDARSLSHRRRSDQVNLACASQYHGRMGPGIE
jgi:hypothetical protein